MKGKVFLEKKFPNVDYADICVSCGFNSNNWRTWVKRNRLPGGAGKILSSFLGIEEVELWKHFDQARPRRSNNSPVRGLVPNEDILPVIKKIARSGVRSVTLKELEYVISIRGADKFSPSVIKEILRHRG